VSRCGIHYSKTTPTGSKGLFRVIINTRPRQSGRLCLPLFKILPKTTSEQVLNKFKKMYFINFTERSHLKFQTFPRQIFSSFCSWNDVLYWKREFYHIEIEIL